MSDKELPYRYRVAYGSRGSSKSWAFSPTLIPKPRLTDEEIAKIYSEETGFYIGDSGHAVLDFARAIEQKVQEKNT